MDARRLSADLSVGPQITAEDIETLADQGFRSVVCNRPDGEAGDQPAFSEIAAAAEAKGIEMRYLPIFPGQLDDTDAAAFRQMLKDLPAPVLAYCRSGTRSAMLWALAVAEAKPLTDILAATQAAGYDASGLIPRLATRAPAPAQAAPS
jgi:sulfide:quinone oxidoreductase